MADLTLPLDAAPKVWATHRPRAAADWPLIGDIVAHRAEVPEHLIRWRRAQGAPDPLPSDR